VEPESCPQRDYLHAPRAIFSREGRKLSGAKTAWPSAQACPLMEGGELQPVSESQPGLGGSWIRIHLSQPGLGGSWKSTRDRGWERRGLGCR